MALLTKEVEVPKEVSELMDTLVAITLAVKSAGKDGWGVEDIPAVVMAAVAELPTAVAGLDQLDDEAKAHPEKMAVAVALGLSQILAVLLKKEAE